ncbi:39S ribosomal protein L9 [Trichuris trichiura]|uniref:39S ribosomal protein L9 n=1 Tax=Trichuris trichiura TaxID=36087 RepID=A0A077ZFI9_TRITR|nr:39S ribosomal protein L9 [Trichuris trichiura]
MTALLPRLLPAVVSSRVYLLLRRSTWVLKHAFPLPVTPPGRSQRPPWEKKIFQCYEIVESDEDYVLPPVALILLCDVEGYGRAFDVIEVDSKIAHNEFLLPKKAVYASEFNQRLYNISPEKMKSKGSRLLTFEHKTSKQLHSLIVIVNMSFDTPWVLEKWHVQISLRRQGFIMDENCILLPRETISGPNIDLEAKLFRFYVVVSGLNIYTLVLPLMTYVDK